MEVQLLDPLKTRAKDNQGKTYWIYSANDQSDVYTRNHVLDLAKNIKRKDPVFALLNREMVESVSQSLYSSE